VCQGFTSRSGNEIKGVRRAKKRWFQGGAFGAEEPKKNDVRRRFGEKCENRPKKSHPGGISGNFGLPKESGKPSPDGKNEGMTDPR
jgi:hypothetical protein